MKVLISAAGRFDGQVGGGQIYVQHIARELHARGHEIVVVSADPWQGGEARSGIEWRDWEGIRVAGVSFRPSSVRASAIWSEAAAPLLDALCGVLDEVKPEVAHLNGMKAPLVAIARERKLPHVITAHHAGIACAVGDLLRSDDSICDRSLDVRACSSCYCGQLQNGRRFAHWLAAMPPSLYRPLGRGLDLLHNPTFAARVLMYPWLVERSVIAKQTMLKAGQRFIAPSRAIAAVLTKNGAAPDRIHVIPHGIHPLPRAPIVGLGDRPVRFGYVGRIQRAKGLKQLLAAFAQLPAGLAELHVFGEPQRNDERKYFTDALMPCEARSDVFLHGAVPHTAIGEVMAGIDVLVLPTLCLEVFGLVILEAFSVGRPVLVTDSGGPSEIVRDGVDGIIVPPNDVGALSTAMRSLAERPEQIEILAANILPVRTLANHVRDVEKVYAAAIEGDPDEVSIGAAW
jgi:glycosyltransferase involved in cell wall biosynthesis